MFGYIRKSAEVCILSVPLLREADWFRHHLLAFASSPVNGNSSAELNI